MQSLEQLDQFTLTGLDNRNRYMELLEAGKENALKQVGGIYMDLNGLKRCNDCFGHAAGDALICRAADALNDVFPGEACRIGGDEFVVICCPVTQEKFEQQVVKRILAPMGNEVITLVKDTSLANTIANKEIIMMAKEYSAKGLIWPLFSTALFFLVFVGALTLLFNWAEKKLDYFRC